MSTHTSYEEQVLALVVNADSLDTTENPGPPIDEESATTTTRLPFPVQQLAQFDFRLRGTNFNSILLTESDKRERALTFFDWDSVCKWYSGRNLVEDLDKKGFLADKLVFNPYESKHDLETVLRHGHVFRLDDETPLHKLRNSGISLKPVWVEADGSCLVHSASVALTGTQLYSEAFRFAIYEEVRDHKDYYLNVGIITEEDRQRFGPLLQAEAAKATKLGFTDRASSMKQAYDELMSYSNTRPAWSAAVYQQGVEKARPAMGEILTQERYLEEIHIAALSNVLKRPIIILGESFQGGIFCPFRHNPEDCKVPGTDLANPPLVIFEQYEHYVPFCIQRKEDYWSWVKEMFPDDDKAIQALEMYEMERNGQYHRIPEWVEEIAMYAAGAGAIRLDEMLTAQGVEKSVADECREAFGRPREMQALPIAFAIGDEPVLCEKTLKNQKAMNAVFEAMGFDVLCSTDRTGAVVQLRYLLPELDLEKIQKMTWALYVQMEQVYPVTAFPSSTTGILPCQGNVDKDLWMFVLNMTQREEINIGMARLYCDPVGWNFNTMALDDARDPTSYVAREVIRLKDKFLSLTGKRFDETVAEDLHQQSRIVRSSDLRRQMPKALPTMQTLVRSMPYPGRDKNLLPDHVALVGYGSSSTTVLLSEVPVKTLKDRQYLVDTLRDKYGLPENEGCEKLAASVFLFARHSEARTRLIAANWVQKSMDKLPETITRQRFGPYGLDTVMVSPVLSSSQVIVDYPSLTTRTIEEVLMGDASPIPPDHKEEEVLAAHQLGKMEISPPRSPSHIAPDMSPRKHRLAGASTTITGSSSSWNRDSAGGDACSDGGESDGVVIVDGSDDCEEPRMTEIHLRVYDG